MADAGRTLESAARHTRGGGAPAPDHDSDYATRTKRVEVEQRRLIQWAQENGKLGRGRRLPPEFGRGGEHQVYSAKSDIEDGADRELVTAYALKRPDGKWSLLVVNRDQQNSHRVRIAFHGTGDSSTSFAGPVETATFGSGQYKWNPPRTRFMAHAEIAAAPTIVAYSNGSADPDGPILRSQQNGSKETLYDLPASSVTVIRGKIALK